MRKLLCLGLVVAACGWGQDKVAEKPAAPASVTGQETHFHHIHLNATDPPAAIDFYTSKFDAERATFAGTMAGAWAQKSWILFAKVNSPPPATEILSGLWHFGWGAEDMKATYQKQLDSGTKFQTPITDIGPAFFFAYVDGPDHALIELNTAAHHHFGHVHMLSLDPIKAGEFYQKWFGATGRFTKEEHFIRQFPVSPSANLMVDNVNIIIFPVSYARVQWPELWKDRKDFEPTKGRVFDHIGFSVDNLEKFLDAMRKDGVNITQEMRAGAGGRIKYAFIEGPDHVRIELVEGHAKKE